MKRQIFLKKIQYWLLRFIQIQLFISSISLPILVSWGLPISLVSPLGNLIFFPFLVAFLLLSSFVFFFQIICIPNGWLIWPLEKVTSWWITLLSLGKGTSWLIAFGTPPTWFLFAVPLSALAIIQNKKTNSLKLSTTLLFLLLISAFSYLKLINKPIDSIHSIECNCGDITLIQTRQTTTLIDPGLIGRRISAPSWIEYTLAPTIIKTTGSNYLDNVIVLQPGIITFKALEKLCITLSVGTIYLPSWEGKLSKNGWRSFFYMKQAAEKNGTKILRIGRWKRTISLSDNNYLYIKPLEDHFNYHEATYPALLISGQIDNQPVTIYSAKYATEKDKLATIENKK